MESSVISKVGVSLFKRMARQRAQGLQPDRRVPDGIIGHWRPFLGIVPDGSQVVLDELNACGPIPKNPKIRGHALEYQGGLCCNTKADVHEGHMWEVSVSWCWSLHGCD